VYWPDQNTKDYPKHCYWTRPRHRSAQLIDVCWTTPQLSNIFVFSNDSVVYLSFQGVQKININNKLNNNGGWKVINKREEKEVKEPKCVKQSKQWIQREN